ncbi:MAG: hypothetical protein KC482_11885 [Dehalococcoidia bacterium]|nr:hypothetical protein [Dehalococcoidia bacterium]MCA9844088.1 hypothetical protein [Dehalococcoidia bacterium]MCA9854272.1 hypothetical protein [Dehalococcoidia bacterium]
MTRSTNSERPCPFCGRTTRAYTSLQLHDVERAGMPESEFTTLICRDCAFAMVLKAGAAMA